MDSALVSLLPALAIGAITGVAIGVISIVSDALVYSRYFRANPMAGQYRNPLLQLGLFLAIAATDGAIQGALFILVWPVLPTGLLAQGAAFGLGSYVVPSWLAAWPRLDGRVGRS